MASYKKSLHTIPPVVVVVQFHAPIDGSQHLHMKTCTFYYPTTNDFHN